MSAPDPTRIVVVGAGTFGRNHLRVWRELEASGLPVHLTGIVEPNSATAAQLAAEFSLPVYSTVEDMLAAGPAPDAASLVAPTSLHFEIGSQLLAAGVHVLIEKPMAATLRQADDLIALAEHHNLILQPGHLERFNPAVRAVRPIVHHPLFFEIHRLSIFTPRSLDVDVVLDLMIHDLDLVLSFTGSPVRELRAVGLPVLSPTADIANVRVEFESGCVANFTASRISTERVRKMRFFQPRQYISIDYARRDVLSIEVAAAGSKTPTTITAPSHPAEPHHPTAGFSMRKLDVSPGEPLRLELESFLRAVRTRTAPEVTARDGRAALALALDIRSEMASHRARAGLKGPT